LKKILFIFLLTHLLFTVAKSQTGWVQQNSGTGYDLNSVFFVNSNTGYAVGDSIHTNSLFLKTSDGGLSWARQLELSNISIKSVFFLNPDSGFACGDSSPGWHFLKTINGGNNWDTLSGSGYVGLNSIFFINSQTGFMAGGYQLSKFPGAYIMKTTSGGVNWNGQLLFNPGAFTSIHFPDSLTGYACGSGTPLFKTTNTGVNWFMITTPSFSVRSLNFVNAMTGWCVDNSKFYLTINGGISWNEMSNQSICTGFSGFNSVKFFNDLTGWVCGCQGSIYGTTDGGTSWIQQSIGIASDLYSLSFVSALTGWAVGANGYILKTTTGGLTFINSVSTEIPNGFSLSQNYPNPFNPTTIINFHLPVFSNVSLKIYDMLGSEVVTLVNEELSPGIYEIEFDARLHGQGSNYSSGVYFYTLSAGSYIETKKMVLLK
jgi:photosystem II stability/assembly factor-like uncharacterized protein